MRLTASLSLILVLAGSVAGAAFGCGGGDNSSSNATTGTAGAGNGNTGGAGTAGGGNTGGNGAAGGVNTGGNGGAGGYIPPPPTSTVQCQNQIYQCGDLVDNDMDGLIDYQDPDCLGPCDNTEDNFYGGIPGQTGAACIVDCYFDSNSGAGNDICYWTHECDPNQVAPGYYPEPENGASCEYDPNATYPGSGQNCADMQAMQSQTCYDYCAPLVPNGCDCFGCCVFPNLAYPVWLGSEGIDGNSRCSLADLDDPTKCHPCIQVQSCLNTCAPCEVCIGKPLPGPECDPTGSGGGGGAGNGGGGGQDPGDQCPSGVQPCGLPGQDPCTNGWYCITGCCVPPPN